MLLIEDDGSFELPIEAAKSFTRFLERNGVDCVGVGRIRTPFDHAKIQALYLKWVKPQQRRRRRVMKTIVVVASLLITIAFASLWLLLSYFMLRDEQVVTGTPKPAPDEVDRILESLTLGSIAYNTPSSMVCDESTKIQLVLSPRATIEALKQKINGLGQTVAEHIRVADVMEVRLHGKAFETHALRPERQAISGANETEWLWEITAREPGNQELHLVVSAVLNVNGREGSRVLKVYDRTIEVHVTISHLAGTFVASNWPWLVGAGAATGAIAITWLVRRRRSREARRLSDVVAHGVPGGKIKVLLFAANPVGTDPLDLYREFREIDEEIRLGEYRDTLELIIVPGTRLVDLLRKLNEIHPHIVHFSGHGNLDQEIILEGGNDDVSDSDRAKTMQSRDMRPLESVREERLLCSPAPLSKSALASVLQACDEKNIRVVVLNACHTAPQAEAIAEVIDCVISMNRAISDLGAIKFAASFYGALAFGRSVKKAFDQGLARLKAEGISEAETPEPMVRTSADASTLVLVGPRDHAEANRRELGFRGHHS
jgi:hypothetical protein